MTVPPKNKLSRILLFSIAALTTIPQTIAETPQLSFGKDGKFKIVQFTDVHYIYGKPESTPGIDCINKVIEAENPDLVLITGDLIFGEPARESMSDVLSAVAAHGKPFGIMFGNHDDEQGMSRAELMEMTKAYNNNLSSTTPGIHGVSNYIIPVRASDSDSTAAVLYCLDSNSYSTVNGVGGYDFIYPDQIEWYRNSSDSFTAANEGKPVYSLAFFHIPLPEFKEAAGTEDARLCGTRMEKVCSPQLNSGLFASMKEKGDMLGVFVGHDHDNDYATVWGNILLAYGRYSGGNTVYNNLGTNGARVIELTEGMPVVDTWLRFSDGTRGYDFHFDRNRSPRDD